MNREEKNIAFGLTAVIGIVLIIVVNMFFLGSSQSTVYKSKDGSFRMKYPVSWQLSENHGGAAVFFQSPKENDLDTFYENVNVVVQDLRSGAMTLNEYSDVAMNQVKAVFKDSIVVVEEKRYSLSQQEGFKFVFIGKGADLEVQMMCVWTIKDDIAYQITYVAERDSFEKYIAVVEKLISSFRIL